MAGPSKGRRATPPSASVLSALQRHLIAAGESDTVGVLRIGWRPDDHPGRAARVRGPFIRACGHPRAPPRPWRGASAYHAPTRRGFTSTSVRSSAGSMPYA